MENATIAGSMTPEEYLKNRVDAQLKWYDEKSGKNRKWYYRLRTTTIVSSALIPMLIGYSNSVNELKYVAGLLGVVVAICEGLMSLRKYKDNWLTYRGTAESLQREKILFQNNIGETLDDAYHFKVFVLKAEQIMSSENSNWLSYITKIEDKPKDKA